MPVPPAVIETPPVVAPPVGQESLDEFGYKIVPVEGTPPVVNPAKPGDVTPPVVVEKESTGYGAAADKPIEVVAPVIPVVPVVEKKLEDMTDEEKAVKEITDTIKTLGDGYNKEKISKFITEHKFTKAQVDAYINHTKEEDAQFIKDQAALTKQREDAKVTLHNGYKKELLEDADFGGEHFDKNVERVNKVLTNNMPNLKKMLTDKGGVLPPSIMRDLLSLSKVLNPINKHIGGDPPAPPEESGDFIEDMYGKQSN